VNQFLRTPLSLETQTFRDWILRKKIDDGRAPKSRPSARMIAMGFPLALLMGFLVSTLNGFWEAAGAFGVAGIILVSWFMTGAGLAEYQRAAYFRAKRQFVDLSSMDGIEFEMRRAKRPLIAAARAYVEQLTRAKCESMDFSRIPETTKIFHALRPHLSQEFLNRLERSGRAMLVAPVGSRLSGVAYAFLDELDRLEREWGLLGPGLAQPSVNLVDPPLSPDVRSKAFG